MSICLPMRRSRASWCLGSTCERRKWRVLLFLGGESGYGRLKKGLGLVRPQPSLPNPFWNTDYPNPNHPLSFRALAFHIRSFTSSTWTSPRALSLVDIFNKQAIRCVVDPKPEDDTAVAEFLGELRKLSCLHFAWKYIIICVALLMASRTLAQLKYALPPLRCLPWAAG